MFLCHQLKGDLRVCIAKKQKGTHKKRFISNYTTVLQAKVYVVNVSGDIHPLLNTDYQSLSNSWMKTS